MIIQSHFKPALGLGSAHIQTLLPTFLRAKAKVDYLAQTLELQDGDFVDLAWTEIPATGKPIIVIFHGLEGSIHSPYIIGLMQALKAHHWTGLLMHFRGCSGRNNRLPRSYHSGETGDAHFLLDWLRQQYPNNALAAVGYSLGGNMLLKLQAELGSANPLKAAVSVSAPLLLAECATRLDKGFSKIYQRHLLARLKRNLASKAQAHDYKQLINLDHRHIKNLNNFRQFDHRVTAPLHGFSGADDYYRRCSARQFLKKIQSPTLIIQAMDDPFMTHQVIPDASELSKYTQLELTRRGGHVGFISGHPLKLEFWLEQRIPQYLGEFL